MALENPNGEEAAARVLDLRGLRCPLPVMKAQKAMRSMETGERIWLETTDPLAAIDIPNFCQTDGHACLETESVEGYMRFLLEKGGG